ncbi:tRNA (adenosine(37)-N6)-threonylcarbamoyltransferase complex ATPase subunit type 1 TsaE [Mucilaginibacter myungsuensis]|uniref:tRNA threonylcarbamoyladenosine biosynthesis protein TsaE n=1 Tax=Mucilaginibacter myungsuensis TaxID=649104 RepID=A0A929KZD7_9SPHI|nr:tRNA (adenosine(37)-N6)-threonylcarbamoyltransferase complex ATPase subunit type 1 TsaE [Mucilaginibacter myungsuensis]MBE9663355.1 tRNA (adenosine(37)-N6)-threonylcarbamoyltransferase complex ATPase subunit type 1 TsaE [Mucilaginibacter myungsuensis]MDN3600090.1 tRNA (adenosine(37)-N6)-threonylcarbamoyltransferase complex ATPase subunit type 1 TsaE [Mucilaginibacter myungsuensis]
MQFNFSLNDIPAAASQVLDAASPNKIFVLYGEMGAGKTTFIKSLCDALGAEGQANSPTFSIVNEYVTDKGPIYHFDFYRLKDQTEALDMGYEEYFYSGNYCFIEWPERIPDLLPANYTEIHIEAKDDGTRQITLVNI